MSDNDYYETDEGPRQFPWYLLTGLILGLAIGLLVSLVVSPVRYTDNPPSALAAENKSHYRLTIAQAYQANQDAVRARRRLALLGDASAQASLASQAQLALAAGDENTARVLADLAAALSSLSTAEAESITTPSPSSDASASPQTTLTPLAAVSPSPTRAPVYVLVEQQTVCEAGGQAGLLQVEVRDSSGEPVPGVQINIAWDGGLDTFFTGLKPAIGAGYADFQMTPGVMYSLRVGSSETLNDLVAPECQGENGGTFTGGVKLVFGQ
ncbi:MAG: hypothetical protein ACYCYC_10445 [Bellilinea sp.]